MSAAKTMKAVIYTAPNTVEVVDKEVPVPEAGEVVCKVEPRQRRHAYSIRFSDMAALSQISASGLW